ncbi:MAG: Asp/Glu racemase [Betaproteobacteria bacterium]|nr:Asp/Glu racemase [Betaproteobacteria bacterium]
MKLLVINPNTTPGITDLVVGAARRCASPGTEVSGATGRFGARYIASRAAYAVATHAALDAYAEHGEDADAVILACFGDPGLAGLKEIAHQPVVGFAEVGCRRAAELGRFSIVTGGERWGPMLREFVDWLGLGASLASVRTVAPSGADIARDPDGSISMLAEACIEAVQRDGAQGVVLGGAGLAGLAARIAPRVPAPVIDPIEASVAAAEALARAGARKPQAGDYAASPAVETIGLAAPLAHRFTGRKPGRGR